MDFNDYQKASHSTFKPTDDEMGLKISRLVLGIAGEAGECAEKVKKFLRRDFGTAELKQSLSKEMGDVLWYLSETCNLLGLSLEEVAKANIKKLQERQKNNTIKGSGDDR